MDQLIITSASSLSPTEVKKIEVYAAGKLGSFKGSKVNINKNVGAGIKLSVGSRELDLTLVGYLARMTKSLS